MSNGVRDSLSKRITSVKSRSFLCQMAVGRDGQDTNAYNTKESSRDTQYRLKNGGLNFWVGYGTGGVRELERYIPKFGELFLSFSQAVGREREMKDSPSFFFPGSDIFFPNFFRRQLDQKKVFPDDNSREKRRRRKP